MEENLIKEYEKVELEDGTIEFVLKDNIVELMLEEKSKKENELILTQEQSSNVDREVKDDLWYDEKGNLMKNFENFEILLRYLKTDIVYNEISKEELICINGKYKILEETDITELQNKMGNIGLNIPDRKFYKFIMLRCKSRSVNFVKNFLNDCYRKYDGKDYIREIAYCLIVPKGQEELKDKLLTKWLLNCVHIAINTIDRQHNTEGLLTLQGSQGLGKTRFLRSLIPNPDWFKDGLCIDPKNKDDLMKSLRYWVCELGEVDATLKKEQSVLKQFFTSTQDDFRVPYDRKPIRLARTTCFCASVNQKDFLKDPTGNRRWWVIECLDIKQHNVDLVQLWGQVAHIYKEGKIKHYLDREELALIEEHNKQFLQGETLDVFLPLIFYNDSQEFREYDTATLLTEYYKLGYGKPTSKAFGKALSRKGYTNRRSNGRTIWKTHILREKIDLSQPMVSYSAKKRRGYY